MPSGEKTNKNESGISTKTILISLLIIVAIVFGIYSVYTHQQNEIKDLQKKAVASQSETSAQKKKYDELNATYNYTSKKGIQVKVFHPLSNETVSSPIVVIGEVPGNWSFESSFPVQFVDKDSKIIAQTSAQVLGDWQTDQLVPFSAKIEYKLTDHGVGSVVLKKDNPSGQSGNDDSVIIPVRY